MSNSRHPIFITRQGDDTFLAASIDSPRFCVGAPTEREAFEKAQRALDYYHAVKGNPRSIAPVEIRVISPVYQEKELSVG